MPVPAGAEPFVHNGSEDVGVLLCHGLTSTPQSMRPWSEHLASRGFSVRCPRLPGHGTNWRDLNTTRWYDWYGTVEHEFGELRRRCGTVFVFGQSMGGTLALRLAEQHPDIAGIVLVNPSVTTLRRGASLLPLLAAVVPSVPGIPGDIARTDGVELAYGRLPLKAMNSLRELWRIVRGELGRVRQPLLLFRSAVDHIVEPVNAGIVLDSVGSGDLSEVVLPDSYHVATLDHDAATVFAGSVEFIHRIHRERVREVV